MTNKNTSCYRLTSSSVKELALNDHIVLSIRPKYAERISVLSQQSTVQSARARVTNVMGRYDNGGPNTGPTEMQTGRLLDIIIGTVANSMTVV